MNQRIFLCALAALAILLLYGTPSPAADPPAAGEKWEVSTRMSVEGMNMDMGARTNTVCSPRQWTEPPGGADGPGGRCTVSDFQTSASKVSWKVSCAGPPAMTGTGEITRNGDSAFSGTIRFNSEGSVMVVTMNGRRLGSCTVGQ